MRLPAGSETIMHTLQGAGYECYLVGGSVRDLLLGRRAMDADFTTNARPPELQRLFPGSHYENRFGTVLVKAGGEYHEVTTYRGEGRYSDHRHPDKISFVDRLEDDLKRRDFTINAMAMDEHGEIVDPFGGRADLDTRLIRAVGDPAERLAEDPLRMMRAARLATQLGFTIEPRTAEAIRKHAGRLSIISRERVGDELLKILACEEPDRGIELLEQLSLLTDALPGLDSLRRPHGGSDPPEALYLHALETLRRCRGNTLLRLAALLHVLNEGAGDGPILPASFPAREGGVTSSPALLPQGEKGDGRGLAQELARLRLSNADAARVRKLVESMPAIPEGMPADERSARRLLSALGGRLPEVLRLVEAHRRAAAGGSPAHPELVEGRAELLGLSRNLRQLRELRRLAARIRRERQPLTVADLALNGDDLVRGLGIAPGPRIGRTLRQLLERVLDDPSLNERERLLALARIEQPAPPSTGSG